MQNRPPCQQCPTPRVPVAKASLSSAAAAPASKPHNRPSETLRLCLLQYQLSKMRTFFSSSIALFRPARCRQRHLAQSRRICLAFFQSAFRCLPLLHPSIFCASQQLNEPSLARVLSFDANYLNSINAGTAATARQSCVRFSFRMIAQACSGGARAVSGSSVITRRTFAVF